MAEHRKWTRAEQAIWNAGLNPPSFQHLAGAIEDQILTAELALREPGTGWTRPDGEEFFGKEGIRECGAWWEARFTEVLEAASVPLATGGTFVPRNAQAMKTALLLAADAGGTFLALYQRKVGDLEEEVAGLKRELAEYDALEARER
jgi:hypothetical protein